VVDEGLTARQQRVFVAIIGDEKPLDALAAELGLRRNAIYKVIFDARRKPHPDGPNRSTLMRAAGTSRSRSREAALSQNPGEPQR
jgi:hypothetical protein